MLRSLTSPARPSGKSIVYIYEDDYVALTESYWQRRTKVLG